MDIAVLLLSMCFFFAIGMPIAYALALSSLVGALWIDLPVGAVMQQFASGVGKVSMLTIPFFVLAGAIMARAAWPDLVDCGRGRTGSTRHARRIAGAWPCALGHDGARQHEEWNCQHRDLADAAGELLHDRADRQVDPERRRPATRAPAHRRSACDREEEAHAEQENGDIHGNHSTGTWASLPSRGGGPMVSRSTTYRNIMAPLQHDRKIVMPTDSQGIRRPSCPRWCEQASGPHDHEQRDHAHEYFAQEERGMAQGRRQQIGTYRHVHVDALTIAVADPMKVMADRQQLRPSVRATTKRCSGYIGYKPPTE